MELILQVPVRLKDVKYGMSEEEAFRTLGIEGYLLIARVKGPPFYYQHRYQLREGFDLELVFNETKQPHSLIDSRLVGEGWTTINP